MFVKTFKETIFSYKQSKVRKDIIGYVYGAWKNSMVTLSRQLNNWMHNWLDSSI
ncbi:hypothetical protein [Bacillus massilioanorexius]|uniref:hypothetical protein n=1 Tax=Bacillus massilioanorexius TaxID=1468413 RepID=UPI001652B266|nr:hypothetical protein [Bacillus massilioanorexius]